MLRLVVDSQHPDARVVEEAARRIRNGGVVAAPTDTLYGLSADPFNQSAVERVFAIKGRAGDRALPLVAADLDQVTRSLGALSLLASTLATRFWPGPLTLVVHPAARLADGVASANGTVGVRVPDHAVTRLLAAGAARLLTATSANVSGRPATADPDRVAAELGGMLDVLLDAGVSPGGSPSTIVDVTGERPILIRAGAIAWEAIEACVRHA